MPDNHPDPILPIPSDLHLNTEDATEALHEVRRQVAQLGQRYRDLLAEPESLRTDDLGRPIAPAEAVNCALMWLESTDRALSAAEDGIGHARSYTTRLSLTEQACDEREQRIADRQAAVNRRRDIRRAR
ncbi:hypothetical protein ACFVVM_03755 [Nocardia sp. NPDC058176]|uniref:hypothetical protein n=1 Tax=Nocardia sp. NPDC058176 TaxID=3346368 RepID=UPI0036D82112